MLLLFFSLFFPAAQAGSGPWALSEGDASFYGGAEFQRLTRLALSSGSRADDVLDVDDGLETFGLVGVVSYGLRDRFELEASVPWYQVAANNQRAVCDALAMGACETTSSVGVLTARAKWLVVDELAGSPVSLALGGEARFGAFTASTRERITNVGEGTTDFGAFASLGRSGGIADGFWSAWVEGGWRHRLPNTDLRGAGAVPGSETTAEAEFLLGAQRWWSLGPSASLLWRPSGLDVEDILARPAVAKSVDRWGALSVFSLRVGGKLIVRSSERVDFVAGVMRTAHAVNNPADVVSVSLGISVHPGPADP